MADAARSNLHTASYADLEALPDHVNGEIIAGDLVVSPRPALRHARASSRLGARLGGPFDLGDNGPGGWQILFEPELHLGDDVVIPDLGGWRVERLPEVPDEPWLSLAPDWVCEVASPSTAAIDRGPKREIYAREGVTHLWIVEPHAKTLEILRLADGVYFVAAVYSGDDVIHPEPFDALPFELAVLWS
jgi:Uma2 family endonuclease